MLGEERLALRELGRLGVLLGLDLGQLGVEVGELRDLVVVDRLDGVHLDAHLVDLGLHVGQVGVDPVELGARGRDHSAQVRLEPVELGDPILLRLDLGRDRLLLRQRVGQLVAGRDRRRAQGAAEQRYEQGGDRGQADGGRQGVLPGGGRAEFGDVPRWASEDHRGDVTLRANSVARVLLRREWRLRPPVRAVPGAHPGRLRLPASYPARSSPPLELIPGGAARAHRAPRIRNGPNGM